jgi:hypothetical protein
MKSWLYSGEAHRAEDRAVMMSTVGSPFCPQRGFRNYPNMPAWLSRADVYVAWSQSPRSGRWIHFVGHRHRFAGLLMIAVYAARGSTVSGTTRLRQFRGTPRR